MFGVGLGNVQCCSLLLGSYQFLRWCLMSLLSVCVFICDACIWRLKQISLVDNEVKLNSRLDRINVAASGRLENLNIFPASLRFQPLVGLPNTSALLINVKKHFYRQRAVLIKEGWRYYETEVWTCGSRGTIHNGEMCWTCIERNFQVFVGLFAWWLYFDLFAHILILCMWVVEWGGAAMQGNYLGKGYIISLSDLIDDEGPTPI